MARPDCFTTFDFDGAVGSYSTVHLGFPVPVFATTQPTGALPIVSVSNVIVSAKAAVARTKSAELGRANLVRANPVIDCGPRLRSRGASYAEGYGQPQENGRDRPPLEGSTVAVRSIPKFERVARRGNTAHSPLPIDKAGARIACRLACRGVRQVLKSARIGMRG